MANESEVAKEVRAYWAAERLNETTHQQKDHWTQKANDAWDARDEARTRLRVFVEGLDLPNNSGIVQIDGLFLLLEVNPQAGRISITKQPLLGVADDSPGAGGADHSPGAGKKVEP